MNKTTVDLTYLVNNAHKQKIFLPQKVQTALKALYEAGFANTMVSKEAEKHVITLVSSKEMFNKNMKVLVDIGNTGVLLRCRTSIEQYDYFNLHRNMN